MSNNSLSIPTTKTVRQKVVLEQGCSPLDWAHLKTKKDLRIGWTGPRRYSPEEVAVHNKQDDIWICIMGKVYDVTPYVKFHPGGIPMLMSVAGRDGTKQFIKYHQWVNCDNLLDKCFLGYMV